MGTTICPFLLGPAGNASSAQLAEHVLRKLMVVGSILAGGLLRKVKVQSCVLDTHNISERNRNDPGRARTCNPRLRGPMPCPLGHGAVNTHQRYPKQTLLQSNATTPTAQPHDTTELATGTRSKRTQSEPMPRKAGAHCLFSLVGRAPAQ